MLPPRQVQTPLPPLQEDQSRVGLRERGSSGARVMTVLPGLVVAPGPNNPQPGNLALSIAPLCGREFSRSSIEKRKGASPRSPSQPGQSPNYRVMPKGKFGDTTCCPPAAWPLEGALRHHPTSCHRPGDLPSLCGHCKGRAIPLQHRRFPDGTLGR